MKWLFCGSRTNNNEEYKKVIRARMSTMGVLFVIVLITLTIALLAKNV